MTYTGKELSRKLDLPERTVSVWAERQLLRPELIREIANQFKNG